MTVFWVIIFNRMAMMEWAKVEAIQPKEPTQRTSDRKRMNIIVWRTTRRVKINILLFLEREFS